MGAFTILYVEDDPSDRFLMARTFGKVAPSVRLKAVGDGEEALAYLAGKPPFDDRASYPMPGLVLLDLKIPRRSGFEVLTSLRTELGLRMPVIVLSSSAEADDVAHASACGATSYMAKGVDLTTLRELVRGLAEYAELLGRTPAAPPP